MPVPKGIYEAARGEASMGPRSHPFSDNEAARHIQTLWRKYRDAVDDCERAQPAPGHSRSDKLNAAYSDPALDEAAAAVQCRWRELKRAIGEALPPPAAAAATPTQQRAACRIQQLWRHYRRVLLTTVQSSHPTSQQVTHAALRIQRIWRRCHKQSQELSPNARSRSRSGVHTMDPLNPHAFDAVEQTLRTLLREDDIEPPDPQQESLEQQQQRRAEFAAMCIQRHWRNFLRLRRLYPSNVITALRQVQSRFRLRRLRRIIRERDRNAAIVRIQEVWRRKRSRAKHFKALRRGREEAAAVEIQRAFRRHSAAFVDDTARRNETEPPCASSRPASSGPPRSVHAASYDEFSSCVPHCIICLDEVVSVAFLPCGHAQLCEVCAARLLRCPTCRKVVALRVKIYF